jgi:hypothetical protein
MRVLGHELPGLVARLIESGAWIALGDSPGFKALCMRYGVGHNPTFYGPETMETETRQLFDPSKPYVKIFLGIGDESAPPGDIDPRRCVLIADFGIGADQPIALDYRCDPPRVITLRWSAGAHANRWITLAEDCESFHRQLVESDDPGA